MYLYIKALHIVFVVTWFAGLFYVVRLMVYLTETMGRPEPERSILQGQLRMMIRRLWLGITWPSAVLTFLLGPCMAVLYGSVPSWLWVKLLFVALLYGYHGALHWMYLDQRRGIFRFTSFQLRLWNEGATVLLFAIVFLAVLKTTRGWIYGLSGVAALTGLLIGAIKLYKYRRDRKARGI